MNNFGDYLTPKQMKARGDKSSLKRLKRLAKQPDRTCPNCDENIWRYGDCGLCFTCTTGEADASDDLELVPEVAA